MTLYKDKEEKEEDSCEQGLVEGAGDIEEESYNAFRKAKVIKPTKNSWGGRNYLKKNRRLRF